MSVNERLAYLAGLLDGEGSVSIRRVNNRAKSPSGGKTYYAVEMKIYNTDRKMIDWIKDSFGGSVYEQTPQKLSRRPLFIWLCSGVAENLELMKQIRPYVITKAGLIDCAIPVLELQSQAKGTREEFFGKISSAGEAAMQKVSEIKLLVSHRGVRSKFAKAVV